jgi:hypothetical protein
MIADWLIHNIADRATWWALGYWCFAPIFGGLSMVFFPRAQAVGFVLFTLGVGGVVVCAGVASSWPVY